MRLAWLLTIAVTAASSAQPAPSSATEWHPVISAVGAWRVFNDQIDLRSEWAYGARMGLESSSRFSLVIDYVECQTWRRGSGRSAEVMALRALGRVDALRGRVRPYLIGGLGGLLLQFRDAPNTAVGSMILGVGGEKRFAERWRLFGEASVDHYYYESVFYTSTGGAIPTGQKGANVIWTGSIGIGASF
jgi:hypothetical protein